MYSMYTRAPACRVYFFNESEPLARAATAVVVFGVYGNACYAAPREDRRRLRRHGKAGEGRRRHGWPRLR